MGLLEATLYQDFRVTLTRTVDERLRTAATAVSRALRPPGRAPEDADLGDVLESLGSVYRNEGLAVVVFDRRGRPHAGTVMPAVPFVNPHGGPLTCIAGKEEHARRILSVPADKYVVEAALPWDPTADSLEILRDFLALLFVASLALVGTGGWVLVGAALQPIDAIAAAAERITADDLSDRLPPAASDREILRLVATLNRMIERLSAALESQRRFTADASHELRTPITVLQNEVEVALSRPRSPEEYRRTLENALDESARMGALVRDLLDLVRSDAQIDPLETVRVPLADLCRLVAGEFEARADAAGLRLIVGPLVESAWAPGSPERLRQLLVNLLDNALKYTPAPGEVRLSLAARDGYALLEVRNTGPGIATEHLPRLFERFYRVDAGRSRSTGGTGLGLAICDRIVRQHSGTISVASSPGEGSRFTVRLPGVQVPEPAATHARLPGEG